MKKTSLVLVAILFAVTGILAQTPIEFKYQAVLRNADGTIIAEESVTVDISILEGSAAGTSVFDEVHTVTTTAQGLINLNIGSEANLSVVDFSADIYFIEITVNDIVMGTSQLLSVPYALQAKTAENVFSGNYNDLTNTPDLFDGTWGSLTGTPTTLLGYGITDAFSGSYTDLTNTPDLFDGTWGSLTGTPTTLSGYGITDAFSGSYTDLTNTPTNATTTTDGFMSSADKTKLDNLENANITAGTGISVTGTYPNIEIANTAGGSTHYVGELYGGGVVFWVDETGESGLIVSMVDISTSQAWSDVTNVTVPNGALSDWDGQTNSTNIIAQSTSTSAADICAGYTNADYGTNTYSDWYLPSIGELNHIWNNLYEVQKAIDTYGNGTTTITKNYYWSSSERNALHAWPFLFSAGNVINASKSNPYCVRGVRAF